MKAYYFISIPYHIYHTATYLIKLLRRNKSFYQKIPMRVIVVIIRDSVYKGPPQDQVLSTGTFIYPRGTKGRE